MRWLRFALITTLGLQVLLEAGCGLNNPDSPRLSPPTGTEQFARYIAVGGSMAAGFMDAALRLEGQASSYPALIAGRMGFAATPTGAADFVQPWVLPPGIGSTEVGPGLVAGSLYWNGSGIDVSGTTPEDQVMSLLPFVRNPVPYNNLAVPGATLHDVAAATSGGTSQGGDNPFFDFILRNPSFGNTTMLQQCAGRGPTLITVWIGINDVLHGAMTGTPQVGTNPLAGDNVTPPAVFQVLYANLIQALVDSTQAVTGFAPLVVVANIPDITRAPYFIPRALFDGIYPFGYEEQDVSLVRFPALSWIQDPVNQGLPVPAQLTLSQAEVAVVAEVVEGYDAAIAAVCDPLAIPVVDICDLCANLSAEAMTHLLFLVQGGLPVQAAAQVTVFSLDGVHLNNHGLAQVANAFLETINEAAGTQLAPVDAAEQTWDPTYGLDKAAGKRAPELLSLAAARIMEGGPGR